MPRAIVILSCVIVVLLTFWGGDFGHILFGQKGWVDRICALHHHQLVISPVLVSLSSNVNSDKLLDEIYTLVDFRKMLK